MTGKTYMEIMDRLSSVDTPEALDALREEYTRTYVADARLPDILSTIALQRADLLHSRGTGEGAAGRHGARTLK
jgi:hypothetical protein